MQCEKDSIAFVDLGLAGTGPGAKEGRRPHAREKARKGVLPRAPRRNAALSTHFGLLTSRTGG